MKNSRFIRFAFALLLGSAPLLFSGCASCKPAKYNIQTSVHESLKDSAIQVDLVGVNSPSLPSWEAYSMTDYWKAGDSKRRDALDKISFDFVSGKSLKATL